MAAASALRPHDHAYPLPCHEHPAAQRIRANACARARRQPRRLFRIEHPCGCICRVMRFFHEVRGIHVCVGRVQVRLHAIALGRRRSARSMPAIILVMFEHILLPVIGNEITRRNRRNPCHGHPLAQIIGKRTRQLAKSQRTLFPFAARIP